jgi:uncharacterized protein
MLEQENTQKVQDLYAAFGRGDMPAVLEALADDVEWVLPGPADFPMAGTYRGKQAVQAWFGTLLENIEFQVFEPREFIAQGDKVVALIYREAITRRSGRKFAAHDAHVWRAGMARSPATRPSRTPRRKSRPTAASSAPIGGGRRICQAGYRAGDRAQRAASTGRQPRARCPIQRYAASCV